MLQAAVLMAALWAAAWPISFETAADLQRLQDGGLKAFERVQAHATDGRWALRVVFPGSERDTWPGFWLFLEGENITDRTALAFDVYNPSASRTEVSWRIDDLDGRKVFGGQSLSPGKVTTAQIWFGALKYQLNLSRLRGVYIYARKPRADRELFFDNFRLTEMADFFKRVRHVPEHSPAPSGEQAFVVFHRSWMRHVFPDDWPAPDEHADELRLGAARGEFEPLTVSVAACQPLRGLRVSVTDLTGPAALRREQIEIRVVRALDKRWTYHDRARRVISSMPVLLEPLPDAGLSADAGQVVRFWLTVHVPRKHKAGVYRGELTISATAAGRAVEQKLPVRLRVYPFELPEPEDMLWGVYYTGPSAFEPGDDLDKLERHMRDMRAHGMTSVGLCFGWEIAQVDVDRHRVDFMPAGRGRWETFMELYKKLKFPAPVIQLSDTPQAAVFSRMSLDDPAAAKAYAEIWEYVEGYAEARGWPEIIVQPVDEPAWQSEEHKKRNLRLLEILNRLAPHVRTEQDGPGDDYFHKLAGPLADVWNYNGGIADPETIRAAQRQGKTILIYNCDVEWYRPEVDRYVAGWFQLAAGINGCFNWAYQSFGGDPYDDQDGPTGDHLAYYPPGHGHAGGPSVAWEGFREGIDDFRYVYLLRQLVDRAKHSRSRKARHLAADAAAELDRLLRSIKYSPRVRGTAKWTKYWTEGDKLFVAGDLKLPNGWTFADYDQARRKVADYCTRLLDALGQ